MLGILADARLVTVSEDQAEVAHEALIREWPLLREWLAEDREGLLVHRHLTEAASPGRRSSATRASCTGAPDWRERWNGRRGMRAA